MKYQFKNCRELLVLCRKHNTQISQIAILREMELFGKKLFFDPSQTRAAIVTCGGLCPGLNDTIRAITMVLWYRYGIRDVLGLRYGYEGLVTSLGHEPIVLTPELVEDIHQDGGTILGSSRGPQNVSEMVDFLDEKRINMLFTIGGDGTQRGALALAQAIEKFSLYPLQTSEPKTS